MPEPWCESMQQLTCEPMPCGHTLVLLEHIAKRCQVPRMIARTASQQAVIQLRGLRCGEVLLDQTGGVVIADCERLGRMERLSTYSRSKPV